MSNSGTPPEHPLAGYGWDQTVADRFQPFAGQGYVPGRVVRVDRGRVEAVVLGGPGPRAVLADTSPVTTGDPLTVPCTGDWAVIDLVDERAPQVRALLPRRTAFLRSTSSKRSEGQVLAANIDHSVICVSLVTALDLGRLERFVSLAWASGAQPLVVLTKSDIAPDAEHLLSDARTVAPGVDVVLVSAATGAGVQELSARLSGGTSVLLGVSGAGKSTLTNALVGEEAMHVAAARDRDGKGRHTTTTRELHVLPGGGVLIDTPGLRGVGLWDAEAGLSQAFADVEELAASCRFSDCAHRGEPGCQVQAALVNGDLPQRRWESYGKLQRENARLAARSDARLRAEQRKEYKRQDALARGRYDMKRRGW